MSLIKHAKVPPLNIYLSFNGARAPISLRCGWSRELELISRWFIYRPEWRLHEWRGDKGAYVARSVKAGPVRQRRCCCATTSLTHFFVIRVDRRSSRGIPRNFEETRAQTVNSVAKSFSVFRADEETNRSIDLVIITYDTIESTSQ